MKFRKSPLQAPTSFIGRQEKAALCLFYRTRLLAGIVTHIYVKGDAISLRALAVATIPSASMQFESCRPTRSQDKSWDFDLLRASLSRDYISRLTPPGKSRCPCKIPPWDMYVLTRAF